MYKGAVILHDHKAKPSGLSYTGNQSCSPRRRSTVVFLLPCCKLIYMKALKMLAEASGLKQSSNHTHRHTHTHTQTSLGWSIVSRDHSQKVMVGLKHLYVYIFLRLAWLRHYVLYYGCCFSEHLLCHRCSPRLISKPLIIAPVRERGKGVECWDTKEKEIETSETGERT